MLKRNSITSLSEIFNLNELPAVVPMILIDISSKKKQPVLTVHSFPLMTSALFFSAITPQRDTRSRLGVYLAHRQHIHATLTLLHSWACTKKCGTLDA